MITLGPSRYGPTIDVLNVNAGHGRKAARWLRNRGVLSFYDTQQRALRALELKDGAEWTTKVMEGALRATDPRHARADAESRA